MSQAPEIVPQGSVAEKYQPVGQTKQSARLELALIVLIVLFIAFVFALLILGTFTSLDTANKALPTPITTPK